MSNQAVCMTGTKKPQLSPKDRIIFALDYQSLNEAIPQIKKLKDHVGLFKLGLTLLLSEGLAKVIDQIQQITGGQKVFVDLKFSKATDIPQQMSGVSSVVVSESPAIEFVTVHTQDGEKFVKEVVEKLKRGTKVLGVTVLTSISEKEAKNLFDGSSVLDRVMELSKIANKAGCNGVVCSGHEVKSIKQAFGRDFIAVIPGIRPSWTKIPMDDQRRVMTPREVIVNGADYIVVGRPISLDKDPAGAADRISEEIAQALEQRE